MTPIPILFEDGEALIIDKPAGLPIERPRAGGACLEDRAHELRLGFQLSPVPVHRLDTDTSGCLLLARNSGALKRFSAAFEARAVEKVYLGVLAGVLEGDEGTIELALSKISSAEKGWRMIPARKGKPSRTHWRKLDERGGLTLVEFRPETGRTHQIRVHAKQMGHPLVGDMDYAGRKRSREDRKWAHRVMLQAQKIEFEHPRNGKRIHFESKGEEVKEVLKYLSGPVNTVV